MASRNNKRELQLTLNSARPRLEFFFALMLLREALTSPTLIGLFNLTLQMIPMIIFIELEELLEELLAQVVHFFSYSNMSLASLGI